MLECFDNDDDDVDADVGMLDCCGIAAPEECLDGEPRFRRALPGADEEDEDADPVRDCVRRLYKVDENR